MHQSFKTIGVELRNQRKKRSSHSSPPTNVDNTNATSSSTESNTSGDKHWNRLKRKSKESGDHRHEFAGLDTISIGSDICVNEDPKLNEDLGRRSRTSYISFSLGFKELCDDEHGDDIVSDYTTSLDNVDVIAKPPPPPPPSASLGNKKPSQPVVTNVAEVVANQVTHPIMFEPSSWPLQHSAPRFDPQETIFCFKSAFVSEMREKLQANLAKVKKDLTVLASKKEKIIVLLDENQEKLSKNQEKITITEGEFYTIEANHTLFDDEVERLSKLEEAVETSCQQILGFKPFP
ncbi:hypothetical protein RND71_021882 [Anisodus tanguticus]|uniref:Uncharacterized protein n=1 Tax=Anisodus tanguticus TaxID=243964 RepID=A0AAE1RXD5_9SOLA|nr:hypothetical protein RND71_021882 [Anisodus tanguticus]